MPLSPRFTPSSISHSVLRGKPKRRGVLEADTSFALGRRPERPAILCGKDVETGQIFYFIPVDVGDSTDEEAVSRALDTLRRLAFKKHARDLIKAKNIFVLFTRSYTRMSMLYRHHEVYRGDVNVTVDEDGSMTVAQTGQERLCAYYEQSGLHPPPSL
jgi:hypothetical protein